jgi:hypothetical protein
MGTYSRNGLYYNTSGGGSVYLGLTPSQRPDAEPPFRHVYDPLLEHHRRLLAELDAKQPSVPGPQAVTKPVGPREP